MAIKIPRVQTTDRLMNQLQQNIIGVLEPIFGLLSGSFQTMLGGCTTEPLAMINWQRATINSPVTLSIPDITGTSNAATATLSGLPKALWPMSDQKCLVPVVDNSVYAVAQIVIGTDGVLTLNATTAGGAFTAAGTKGISQVCVTYMTGET